MRDLVMTVVSLILLALSINGIWDRSCDIKFGVGATCKLSVELVEDNQ